MKKLAILGSTGSIGVQSLDVVSMDKNSFEVVMLSAHSNYDLFKQQIEIFKPIYAIATNKDTYDRLQNNNLENTTVLFGMDELLRVIDEADIDLVLNAIVGSVGILPTYHTLKRGTNLALANKESLVAGGQVVTAIAQKTGAMIIPVDSEHNAIFQCLYGNKISDVEKLILTASGGPFRGRNKKDLETVTCAQALKHPNWSMGRKISIDSSTLVNKGLEVIEAKWIFGLEAHQIDVVVHPQSIIHSMVMYKDGSIISQMGYPDMRHPIHNALYYPERRSSSLKRFDFDVNITFEKPDIETFPGLRLAYDAIKIGGSMPIVYNAVNEVMVERFLKEQCSFYDITDEIERQMESHTVQKDLTIEKVLEIDRNSRMFK